jgi:hypothetical protein
MARGVHGFQAVVKELKKSYGFGYLSSKNRKSCGYGY